MKGVLRPGDARAAVERGVDGVVVSNHGGRQMDGSIAALDALPGVAQAVGDVPVLFDSGIRRVADALARSPTWCASGGPTTMAWRSPAMLAFERSSRTWPPTWTSHRGMLRYASSADVDRAAVVERP